MIARMQPRGRDLVPVSAEFADALSTACRALGLSPDDDVVEALWRHFGLMVEANRRANLTRITTPADAAVKHYADSLALLTWSEDKVPASARVLDVGTGAGLPAVPLAACRPNWRVTAIDGTARKAGFVADAAATLGLSNLTARQARARELAGQVEPFDLITCRAVAAPLDCLREARRLVRNGGWIVCYTTPRTLDGLTPAEQRRVQRLGFESAERHDYALVTRDERIAHALAAWQRR